MHYCATRPVTLQRYFGKGENRRLIGLRSSYLKLAAAKMPAQASQSATTSSPLSTLFSFSHAKKLLTGFITG
jgi:hypothetical protein